MAKAWLRPKLTLPSQRKPAHDQAQNEVQPPGPRPKRPVQPYTQPARPPISPHH